MQSFLGAAAYSFIGRRAFSKPQSAAHLHSTTNTASSPLLPTPQPQNETTTPAAPTQVQEPSKSCCLETCLFRSHTPLAYSPSTEGEELSPVDSSSSADSADLHQQNQQQQQQAQTDMIPILHPNEVLLQRFPHKLSMKRVSELRLPVQPPVSPTPATRASQPTLRRFRSLNLREQLSRIASSRNDPATTASPASPLDSSCNPANQTFDISSACIHAVPDHRPPTSETSHEYLTRASIKGTLYVTSERLLFLPDLTAIPADQTGLDLEFDVPISAIDTMRAVQSDAGAWFFVAYEGMYLTTLPFKNRVRAHSFLKLIANIRFEQMVRHSLPPKYTTQARGRPCCAAGSHRPLCKGCAARELAEWEAEDAKLPTYTESEEAVRQYLINLKLMPQDSPPFDRQTAEFDVMGMLAQACSPPCLYPAESPGTQSQTNLSTAAGHANGNTNEAAPPRRHSAPTRSAGTRTGARALYYNDERLYGVPLVWI